MKQIYMCSPDYFDVEYTINAYMDPEVPVDRALARQQWETLRNVYEVLGAEVKVIPPVQGLPDMTFAANCGHLIDDDFVKANFRHSFRREEARHAARYFSEQERRVVTLPSHLTFEGQGDLVPFEKTYFMGFGPRTSLKMITHLLFMADEMISLELKNDRFYHLDTCLKALNDETVVVSRHAFTDEGMEQIERVAPDIIYTNEQDDSVLGCNSVVVGNTVVVGKGISDELASSMEKRGFEVTDVDMSEFLKSGGSVKCLTLEQF